MDISTRIRRHRHRQTGCDARCCWFEKVRVRDSKILPNHELREGLPVAVKRVNNNILPL